MPLNVSASFNTTQFVVASVTEVDAVGNAVPLSSTPVWTIDNAAVATIVPDPAGDQCGITAKGVGTATVTCTVGSFPPATVAITVTADVGVGLSISVGAPQQQTPAS